MPTPPRAFEPALPGYLSLLHIDDGAPAVANRVAEGLTAPDAAEHFDALMTMDNWRLHLIGALAVLLDTQHRLDRTLLWTAIDGGSWVTPQLVVTACIADRDFQRQAQHRLVTIASTPTSDEASAPGRAGVCWARYSACSLGSAFSRWR